MANLKQAGNSQKRSRAANCAEEERQPLVILKDFSHITEKKCQKTNSIRAKSTGWEEIHKRFNELNPRPRERGQLQIKWKEIKIQARKSVVTSKAATAGTGGGPKPPSPQDIQIVDLLNPGELLTHVHRLPVSLLAYERYNLVTDNSHKNWENYLKSLCEDDKNYSEDVDDDDEEDDWSR